MSHFRITITGMLLLLTVDGRLNAETVYSDIVGVQKVTLNQGWNFVATSFTPDSPTLAGVLGTNQLPADTTHTDATTVDVWNQEAQTLTNKYWLSSASGFEGWRVAPNFTAADSQSVDPDKGMIITIRPGHGGQELLLAGSVPTGDKTQVVRSNAYTIAAAMFPEAVSLDASGLEVSGFVGGSSKVSSDNLLFFNPNTESFDTVWLDSNGGIWRNAIDASVATRTLSPGEAFLIRRRGRSTDMTWTNPIPYNLP